MTIAIDFDGTCVTHEFPKIGKDIGAVPVLKKLVSAGHQLILFTMRSDNDAVSLEEAHSPGIVVLRGPFLTDAVNWFKENEIPLYGIQTNPHQSRWTTFPKCYAELYIDDAALGCPLLMDVITERNYVNWEEVQRILEFQKII